MALTWVDIVFHLLLCSWQTDQSEKTSERCQIFTRQRETPRIQTAAPTPAAQCNRFHERVPYVCIRSCFLSQFHGSSRSLAHSGRTSVPQHQAYRSIGRCLDHMCPCKSRRHYTDRYLRRPMHIYRQKNKCWNSALWQLFFYRNKDKAIWSHSLLNKCMPLLPVCLHFLPYPLAKILTQHFIPHLCAIICQHQQKKRFFLSIQYSVIIIIPWIKMKHFQLHNVGTVIAVKDNKPWNSMIASMWF